MVAVFKVITFPLRVYSCVLVTSLPDNASYASADETVKKMFAAMNEWDEDQLEVVLRGVDLAAISKAYKGCTLVECDSAFKSGTYAGVFVPCKVKLANGKETKLNVAMRSDNLWNIWTLDGGI